MIADLNGRSFSVVGLARSGVAAANTLVRLGADVLASDSRTADAAHELAKTLDSRVQVVFGRNVVRPGDDVVMSPGVPPRAPIFAEARAAGCRILSEVQLFQELRPDVTIAAITGTDGKSTTTSWLGAIGARARKTFVGGNIGIPLSGAVMDLESGQLVVAEISNAQLETAPAFHPRVAVVTNIAPEHLDYHGSFEAYVAAKHRIIENLGPGDTAVLRDDPLLSSWTLPEGARRWLFGRHGAALTDGVDGLYVADGQLVHRVGTEVIRLVPVESLALRGLHNLENAMAAAGAALALGVDVDVVRAVLTDFTGLEHRLERVRTLHGVTWHNDSKATNPHAALAGLTAFAGKALVVIAGGSAKGADFTEWAEGVIPRARHVIVNGATAEAMVAALAGRVPVTRVADLGSAVAAAAALTREWGAADVVLSPACASFDQFRDYEHRGRVFKALVAELQ